jgi:hypothetical protein
MGLMGVLFISNPQPTVGEVEEIHYLKARKLVREIFKKTRHGSGKSSTVVNDTRDTLARHYHLKKMRVQIRPRLRFTIPTDIIDISLSTRLIFHYTQEKK